MTEYDPNDFETAGEVPQDLLDALAAPPPVGVTDKEDAGRVLDKVLAARERVERIKAQAAVRIKAAERELADVERWALPALEVWLEANPPQGKRRSVDLWSGRIGWRAGRSRTVVDDEEAAMLYCFEHAPDAVKQDPMPPARLLVSKIPPDCPGVRVVEGADKFEAKGPGGGR